MKGSFAPTPSGVVSASDLLLTGAPVGVDVYLDDVTITATKLSGP